MDLAAPRRTAAQFLPALALTIAGFACSVTLALQSDGVHHDDDLTHQQFARWAWKNPEYFLHDWGRPAFTIPYAVPACFGALPARIFSGALTALSAWLAYLVARRQELSLAWLTPALLWLQPMPFTLSYTTLTETPAALYLVLALWLHQRRHYALAAATVSFSILARHEMIVIAAVYAIFLAAQRRALWRVLWLAWAPLAHNVASYLWFGYMPAAKFLNAHETDFYGSGDWLDMILRWVACCGLGILTLAGAGFFDVHRRPAGKLILACIVAYVLAHTVFYRFGLFATGGYMRFLVTIGPLVAICAAAALSRTYDAVLLAASARFGGSAGPAAPSAGWLLTYSTPPPGGDAARIILRQNSILFFWFAFLWYVIATVLPEWLNWVEAQLGPRAVLFLVACAGATALVIVRRRWAIISAALLPPALLLALALWQPWLGSRIPPPHTQCGPLRLSDYELEIRSALDWIASAAPAEAPVIGANPWVTEFRHEVLPFHRLSVKQQLAQLPGGALFIWDDRYCAAPEHGITREYVAQLGYREIWRTPAGRVCVYQRGS